MSGYLPKASAFQLGESLKDTPILHCHGIDDQVVSFCSWWFIVDD
jgi:predicted esterase